MPNEKEVKEAAAARALCSVTGRRCDCRGGGGGCARSGSGRLDSTPAEAVRWAKAALIHADAAVNDLESALHELKFKRTYPAPEYRETQRLIQAATALLTETL